MSFSEVNLLLIILFLFTLFFTKGILKSFLFFILIFGGSIALMITDDRHDSEPINTGYKNDKRCENANVSIEHCDKYLEMEANWDYGGGVDSNMQGYHSVDSYYRSDGTYVEGHIRSNPDGSLNNNINK